MLPDAFDQEDAFNAVTHRKSSSVVSIFHSANVSDLPFVLIVKVGSKFFFFALECSMIYLL